MARALLRLMLVRSGYEVAEAEDGWEALMQIRTMLPQAVILDVMMPGLDGYAVCRQVRAQPATQALPVIMLSARSDAESIRKGLEVGATMYLTKPISADDLTHHVRQVLEA